MGIKLNLNIYPLEAIFDTCYHFIDRAYVFLDSDNKRRYVKVILKNKSKSIKEGVEVLEKQFLNELICFSLRNIIKNDNKKIREYIIGRALYAEIPQPVNSKDNKNSSYKHDRLGISKQWMNKAKRDDKYKV